MIMCITKYLDHFLSIEPKRNVSYIFIFLFMSISSIIAVYLIGKYGRLDGKTRSLMADAKIMLSQLPFLILLSISASMCFINAFILQYKKNFSSIYPSDLTEVELYLRNTTENRVFDL